MAQPPLGGLHERDANSIIAEWLNAARSGWRASAERTGTIKGSNDRPDLIIRQGDRMPVIIECEYGKPAVADAGKRLGKELVDETRPFTEVIALGIDERCKMDTPQSFRKRLSDNEPIFNVQLVSGASDGDYTVWPDSPLPGTPADLAAYCEYAQVPQTVIDRQSESIAADVAAAGQKTLASIRRTAGMAETTLNNLRAVVGGKTDADAVQTAAAIWLIAIDLQNDLATHSRTLQRLNLKTTETLLSENSGLLRKADLLEQWRVIAGVNYVPVMELAINSLEAGNMGSDIADVLAALAKLSARLNGLHAKHIYNFAGELWQRLVSDREERAAHYTKPEVAELLSTLSAARFGDRAHDAIAELKLWDAACGTGTLIGAGERALRRLYRMNGGADPDLHRNRIQEHVIALDVNGIAGTLTAKRLTDLDVTQEYASSKIAIVTHEAGSLSLLDPAITGITDYLGYGGVSATPGLNAELGLFHIAPGSIDWALMNPPYSRARGGREQATKGLGKIRPKAAKAGYKMSHGQAGLATDFGNMSNLRMKSGGVLAHVLPLTAAHAETWAGWRGQLETDFDNIVVIANVGGVAMESMSADTGMNEMLVVATKRRRRRAQWQPVRILCVNLHSTPATLAQGYAIAREIAGIPPDADHGALQSGNYIRAATIAEGFPWFAVGNRNSELTAIAAALMSGACWNPVTLTRTPLALDGGAIGKLAQSGPTHHLIGHPKGSAAIGAFQWTPLDANNQSSAHQSLWSTVKGAQQTINVAPTHAGRVVDPELAQRMAASRSVWFVNRNIRWTSQATAVAKSAYPIHGGRSWNALQNMDEAVGRCVALYLNSIFGAIVRNAYGQSTHPGRAPIQVGAIAGLPCPDFAADTPAAQRARTIAGQRFDQLAALPLEPFAYCFRDAGRHKIDAAVADMLGIDATDETVAEMLASYRLAFAGEPNVNGRQKPIVAALAKYRRG